MGIDWDYERSRCWSQPKDKGGLHRDIINLPCTVPSDVLDDMSYKRGFRDARHKAAELVAEREAER